MRFLRQSLTGLFLLAVTVAVLAYAGLTIKSAVQDRMAREARAVAPKERVFVVNVVAAHPGDQTPVLEAFGEVSSRRILDIRAASGGEVVFLSPNFVDGGQVRAGDLLVGIDPADAKSALDRAQSELLDAENETRDAGRALGLARDELTAAQEQADLRERAFQRQMDLKKRGVGTEAAVETAELAASTARGAVLSRRQAIAQGQTRQDQADTRLRRARIALAEAQRRLEDTEIRAEFDGTLTEVAVVEGGLVSAGERLGQVVDGNSLEVAFRVSTHAYVRLLDENGDLTSAPVRVVLDALGLELVSSGQLDRASAAVGEGQSGRLVFATLDRVRGLKPGDFVKVEIEESPIANAFRLPASALGADGEVLVLGDQDRLERKSVNLLRRQGNEVLVRATDLAGREVVASRSPLLGTGIRVKPVRTSANTLASAGQGAQMIELTPERRARLIAFIEKNRNLPDAARNRILKSLENPKVPARLISRIESRMGG
ncbi:MAG: efflux transporter periplasmic adaptor subunit [Rhodobacterales bacterium]|nr:MAG: efflux transporter periplasmic adaptor subunit [Rhodobacterales bacterium]